MQSFLFIIHNINYINDCKQQCNDNSINYNIINKDNYIITCFDYIMTIKRNKTKHFMYSMVSNITVTVFIIDPMWKYYINVNVIIYHI